MAHRLASPVLVAAVMAVCATRSGALVVEKPCCTEMAHASAHFGVASQRQQVRGPLVAAGEASPALCIDDGAFPREFEGAVALVPRGGCRFLDKVLLAQKKGALGVVVYDSNARQPDVLVHMSLSDGDAWRARQLSIPAVFISYRSFVNLTRLAQGVEGQLNVVISSAGEIDPDDLAVLFLRTSALLLKTLVTVCVLVSAICGVVWVNLQWALLQRRRLVKNLPRREYSGDSAPTDVELEAVGCESALQSHYFAAESCVICLGDFAEREVLTVLPCGHGYHTQCIEPWLVTRSSLCPVCKQSILASGAKEALAEQGDISGAQSLAMGMLFAVFGGCSVVVLGVCFLSQGWSAAP